jgi:hypothetical protein
MNDNNTTSIKQTNQKRYTKLESKVKRGSDTRDQDEVKIQTRHPSPIKAVKRHKKAVEAMEALAEKGRNIDPERD